jgi:putative transposase
MSNSYTQIHIHYVFIVGDRHDAINQRVEKILYPHLVELAQENKCHVLAIQGMPDHLHLLVIMHPGLSVSEFAKSLKGNSSHFLNQARVFPYRFRWQAGYGAFSVSHSQIPKVKQYIADQQIHHAKLSSREEFVSLLEKHDLPWQEDHLPE